MLHDSVELSDLLKAFRGHPLTISGNSITGPGPLVGALRSTPIPATTKSRASDVFLWRPGPPRDLRCTFVGKTPFRPRGSAWPAYGGIPMHFIGQLALVDSIDILPILPGDLLQVFFAGSERASGELAHVPIEELLHVEWLQSRDVTQGLESARTGTPGSSPHPHSNPYFHPFHGVRVRVTEFAPSLPSLALGATKVGGFPTDYYDLLDSAATAGMYFIGQIGRVLPPRGVPDALMGGGAEETDRAGVLPMNLGAPGMVCFFLRGDGEVCVHVSSNG